MMLARTVASSLLRRAAARPALARPPLQAAAAALRGPGPALPWAPFRARLLSDQVRSAIDKAVASAPVVLFMKGTPEMPQCGFSRGVVQMLGLQGVNPAKFAAFNVLEDQELRQGIKEYSDWPTIPQLYVDKEFIGGADIVQNLFKSGDLAKLFEEKGLLVAGSDKKE